MGSGLRLMECLRLRIKDIDFEINEIVVRSGKGDNDRRTILPSSLKKQLKHQMAGVQIKHQANMMLADFSGASIPEALARKYPNAAQELAWQYLFPSKNPAIDPRSGLLKQHHRHEMRAFCKRQLKKLLLRQG